MKSILMAVTATLGLALPAHGAGKVLVVLSAESTMHLRDGSSRPTGFYLAELSEPIQALVTAGYDFDVATPGGVIPVVDPITTRAKYFPFGKRALRRAMNFIATSRELQQPRDLNALTDADLAQYVALFVPGGHAPMVDLVEHPSMAKTLMHFHRNHKPTGLLCHGSAVTLSLARSGSWPYAGYRMTVMSNMEERMIEKLILRGSVNYPYPSDSLESVGGIVDNALLPVVANVVRDRELITGQNPFASRKFGRVLVRAIQEYQDARLQ